ncbi:MAG: hypothetical protein IJU57_03930 [Clostridia bacterium]|nr:hypothetical protein [Clostridia bacterium]
MKDEKIERFCKYCEEARTLSDPDTMLCSAKGVISASECCRKFRYDPLKRTPKRLRTDSIAEQIQTAEEL